MKPQRYNAKARAELVEPGSTRVRFTCLACGSVTTTDMARPRGKLHPARLSPEMIARMVRYWTAVNVYCRACAKAPSR